MFLPPAPLTHKMKQNRDTRKLCEVVGYDVWYDVYTLTVVMVLRVFAYVQMTQIVHTNYMQFFACKLNYSSMKLFKKRTRSLSSEFS